MTVRRDPLAPLGRIRTRLQRHEVLPGITELRVWSAALRTLGSPSSCYLVDEAMVDTSFAHVRGLVMEQVRSLRFVALTHHHEDHMGNAGPLSQRHGCPVYLHNAHLRDTEGVVALAPYRRAYWGWPGEWPCEEMPERLHTGRRTLRKVLADGHCGTQVGLLDQESGAIFTGDLFISTRAAAVMSHEDPWKIIASLRWVAELEPSLLLGGHGQRISNPAKALRRKADRVEEAAREAVRLHQQGLPTSEITARLFPGKERQDRHFELLTEGQFSYRNFVRNAVALA